MKEVTNLNPAQEALIAIKNVLSEAYGKLLKNDTYMVDISTGLFVGSEELKRVLEHLQKAIAVVDDYIYEPGNKTTLRHAVDSATVEKARKAVFDELNKLKGNYALQMLLMMIKENIIFKSALKLWSKDARIKHQAQISSSVKIMIQMKKNVAKQQVSKEIIEIKKQKKDLSSKIKSARRMLKNIEYAIQQNNFNPTAIPNETGGVHAFLRKMEKKVADADQILRQIDQTQDRSIDALTTLLSDCKVDSRSRAFSEYFANRQCRYS